MEKPESKPLTEKEISDLVDKQLASLLAQGKRYAYAFLAGFLLLAGAGIGAKQIVLTPLIRWGYPATDIRDDLQKISNPTGDESKALNRVLDYLHEHVDSGYSRVIVFPASGGSTSYTDEDNYLVFYANEDQSVEITVTVETSTEFQYTATVDQKPLLDDVSGKVHTKDIQSLVLEQQGLGFGTKGGLGPYFHLFKVMPTAPPKAEVVVDCVILVKNKVKT